MKQSDPPRTIRNARLSGVDAITEIYNEAILTTTATLDTVPKSVSIRLEWLKSSGERYPVIVLVMDGMVMGWASLSRWFERSAYCDTAETSFSVKSGYRGRGVGRKLKEAIIDEARRLKSHTLIARIAEGGDVSLHLNVSFGFIRVGTLKEVGRKFGRLRDDHILHKMLQYGHDKTFAFFRSSRAGQPSWLCHGHGIALGIWPANPNSRHGAWICPQLTGLHESGSNP
jgi:L-amino acid N-acyltransferase